MDKINKVSIDGDLLKVEAVINGEEKVVSRHVQTYETMSEVEKEKLWHEMVGTPFTEYLRQDPALKVPLLKRILNVIKRRK